MNVKLLLRVEDIVHAIMMLIEDETKAGQILRITPPPRGTTGSPEELQKQKFSFQVCKLTV